MNLLFSFECCTDGILPPTGRRGLPRTCYFLLNVVEQLETGCGSARRWGACYFLLNVVLRKALAAVGLTASVDLLFSFECCPRRRAGLPENHRIRLAIFF